MVSVACGGREGYIGGHFLARVINDENYREPWVDLEHFSDEVGKTGLLPDEKVLEVTTMCGHAMVSPHLLSHLLKKIHLKKVSYREASLELSRQCECGIFNPDRAERLLREMG